MRNSLSTAFGISIAVFLGLIAPAAATVIHDESVNGDLSNDRLNPTGYTLSAGTNTLIATSVSGDREYVRLSVPAGLQLSSIINVSYQGQDGTAFIGVQNGSTFTEPPTGTNVANLLGYTHFGTGPGTVGTDILDNMGTGAGAQGFTPPLPSGNYTYWIQQTGTSAATYQFDFNVTPEPMSAMLFGLAGGALLRRRCRTSARYQREVQVGRAVRPPE